MPVSEISPCLVYQHTCQATRRSLLYHRPYHDFTFTSRRWHIQTSSSPMRGPSCMVLTAHSCMLLSALRLLRCRRQVVHRPTALKHTSTVKLKHYGKLENVHESRHMVISSTLWKILFTFSTRHLNNRGNTWLAHKHEQTPLLRPSLCRNSNHATFLRWAATCCKEHQEVNAPSGTNNEGS